jgi:AcrR family transcriptional regulator
METPLRIMRNIIDKHDGPPIALSTRQRETRERILTLGQSVLAKFGTPTLKFTILAAAMHISTSTVRFHFADLDALLSALVVRHLDRLVAAISEVPNDDPYCEHNRRAAYLKASRAPDGGLNEGHLLLVRDRHFLPRDVLANIEALRHQIGILLAGDRAQLALCVLDIPHVDPAELQNRLVGVCPAARPPAPSVHAPVRPTPERITWIVPHQPFIPPRSLRAEPDDLAEKPPGYGKPRILNS